jgi:hypothetical protein
MLSWMRRSRRKMKMPVLESETDVIVILDINPSLFILRQTYGFPWTFPLDPSFLFLNENHYSTQ